MGVKMFDVDRYSTAELILMELDAKDAVNNVTEIVDFARELVELEGYTIAEATQEALASICLAKNSPKGDRA